MKTLPLRIDAAHPAYPGHFPGRPVTPGVVLLDEAIRAIAVDLALAPPQPLRIHYAKFFFPVSPGTPLTLAYSVSPQGALRFEISDGARCVAAASLSVGAGR